VNDKNENVSFDQLTRQSTARTEFEDRLGEGDIRFLLLPVSVFHSTTLHDHHSTNENTKSNDDRTAELSTLRLRARARGRLPSRRSRSSSRRVRRLGRRSGSDQARAGSCGRASGSTAEDDGRGIGRARRGVGDPGRVGKGIDGRGVAGLVVGGDLAVSTGVDTRGVLVVALASLEDARGVGSRRIVRATDTVIDVVAVLGRVGDVGVASLEAELARAHEAVPLNDLDEVVEVSIALGEGIGEHQATEGVTTLISAVGVELSSIIIGIVVDVSLVDQPSDLNVGRSDEELNGGDGVRRHHAGTVSGGRAPSNGRSLHVCDDITGLLTTPETEIRDGVDEAGLAHGAGASGGRVTDVVAGLRTTSSRVGIDLVREVGPGVMLVGEDGVVRISSGGSSSWGWCRCGTGCCGT